MRRTAAVAVSGAVLAAGLILVPLGALADEPTPSATPTPTAALSVAPVLAPPAVTGIRFLPGPTDDAVTVTWTATATATGYVVQVQVDGAADRTTEVTDARLVVPGVPSGASVHVGVVARGPGGDSPPASGAWTRQGLVPPVTGGRMLPTDTGLRVLWAAPEPAVPNARFLVELRGSDGVRRSRTVHGDAATFPELHLNTLYSATVTTVAADGRRSSGFPVPAVLFTGHHRPGVAPVAPAAPAALPAPSPSATSAPEAAVPQPTMVAASAELIATPRAALVCVVAAVLLAATSIVLLLLRRQRPAR